MKIVVYLADEFHRKAAKILLLLIVFQDKWLPSRKAIVSIKRLFLKPIYQTLYFSYFHQNLSALSIYQT